MRLKKVEFTVEIPVDGVDESQIREWILFRLHSSCSMLENNPLADYDIEAMDVEIEAR